MDGENEESVPRVDSDSGSELEITSECSWSSFERDNDMSSSSSSEEEIGDAGDGLRMETDVRGPGRGRDDVLTWNTFEEDNFVHQWLPEFNQRSGIVTNALGNEKPIDFFKLFFPDILVETIVTETNKYAEQVLQAQVHDTVRKKAWTPTFPEEIWAYIGLQICMGMYPQCSIPDHWSDTFIYKNIFGDIMSRNRDNYISSFLHFSDNADRIPRGQPGYDPFSKANPLLVATSNLYESAFAPHKHISIDETMIAFKGRHHAKQYLPDKVFSAADPTNNFCFRYVLYAGKEHFSLQNNAAEGDGMGEKVVNTLMTNYFGKGHIIYTDSFYTSPSLFNQLREKDTGAVGTVGENRKGYAPMLKKKNLRLKKYDPPKFARCGDLVACSWHDTKRVNLLSTVHSNDTVPKRIRSRHHPGGHRTTDKPVIADAYNKHMGGVDHFNQRVNYKFYPHRCRKWYHPIYHFVKQVALVNGQILYQQHHNATIRTKQFRLEVANALVTPYAQSRLQRKQSTSRRQSHVNVDRLVAAASNHFPQMRTDTSKPRCRVCTDAGEQRVQTKYFCPSCDVPLCPAPCFALYHTKHNYGVERAALGLKNPKSN